MVCFYLSNSFLLGESNGAPKDYVSLLSSSFITVTDINCSFSFQ